MGSRLAAAAALMVLAAIAYAGTQKVPDLQPIFQTDLRTLGWQPPRKLGRGLYYPAPHSPMFLSDGKLVVTLFVENPEPGLSVRGRKFGGQRLFKAFFFDTQSWKVVRSAVLANAGVSTGLFPGPDGSFAVWDNFDLTEHAADGRTLATLELDSHTLRRYFHVFASPSGATLFVESTDRTGTSLLVLRAADLHSFGWFDAPGCYEYRASDSYIACYRAKAYSMIMEVLVSPINRDNHAPLDFRSVFSGGKCLGAGFVSEDTMALGDYCNDLTILNVSGSVVFGRHFDTFVSVPLACRTCDWLVSGTYKVTEENEFFRIHSKTFVKTITLINPDTNKLIEVPDERTIKRPGSGEALSPNGCLLAIQNDWQLEVYDLCHASFADELGLHGPHAGPGRQ